MGLDNVPEPFFLKSQTQIADGAFQREFCDCEIVRFVITQWLWCMHSQNLLQTIL